MKRIAFDRAVELSCDHFIKRFVNGVKRNDDDVFARAFAGGFDGIDCAERFVVVFTEYDVDFRIRF